LRFQNFSRTGVRGNMSRWRKTDPQVHPAQLNKYIAPLSHIQANYSVF
jgi:hypothetical protein